MKTSAIPSSSRRSPFAPCPHNPSDDGIRDYLLSMSPALGARRRWQRPFYHWMAAIPDPC
jgi:hypothetical protein